MKIENHSCDFVSVIFHYTKALCVNLWLCDWRWKSMCYPHTVLPHQDINFSLLLSHTKKKEKKKKLSDGNCDFLFSVNFHSFFWKIDLKRKKNVNFPSVLFTISLIYTSLTWKTFSILPSPSQISMFVFGLCLFRMKYVKRKLLQFENEFVFMLSKLIDNLKLVFSSRSTLITSKVYCDPAPLEQNAHLFVPGARMCVLFGTPK